MSINIVVVCGLRIYRDGIVDEINRDDSMRVRGVFPDCDSVLLRLSGLNPDIVIVDIVMDGLIELIEQFKQAKPDTRIIVLTYCCDKDRIYECVRRGVEGIVSNNDSMEDLKNTILTVLAGAHRYPSAVARYLADSMANGAAAEVAENPLAVLTTRQSRILKLLALGMSNKEIARQLGIEVATVKNHVHEILERLHVSSRFKAAAKLRRSSGYA